MSLTALPIDYLDVLGTAIEIVETEGRGTVYYPIHGAGHGPVGACVYYADGQPSCLVGRILHRLVGQVFADLCGQSNPLAYEPIMTTLNTANIAVLLPSPGGQVASNVLAPFFDPVTYGQVVAFLIALQFKQDTQVPWGDCLDYAMDRADRLVSA